jgi:hypothetical protein
MFKKTLLCGLAVLGLLAVEAQSIKTPAASPTQTLKQDLGIGTVELYYSRPAVKGRKIFGDLVPFGQVWRTGANEATTFEVARDVKIEGKELKAGKYALFTIPGEDEWTIIFNKQPMQWGAFKYDEAQDALRVKVKPTKAKAFTERMTFAYNNGKVGLLWGDTEVDFAVQ